TEARILDAIANNQDKRAQRIHIHHALRAGERVIDYLKTSRALVDVELSGSLRRWKETVSQVVIVASGKRPSTLIDHFLRFPMIVRIDERTNDRVVAVLSEGCGITLIVVKPDQFGMALLEATGSQSHLRKLELVAAKKRKLTSKRISKTAAA